MGGMRGAPYHARSLVETCSWDTTNVGRVLVRSLKAKGRNINESRRRVHSFLFEGDIHGTAGQFTSGLCQVLNQAFAATPHLCRAVLAFLQGKLQTSKSSYTISTPGIQWREGTMYVIRRWTQSGLSFIPPWCVMITCITLIIHLIFPSFIYCVTTDPS